MRTAAVTLPLLLASSFLSAQSSPTTPPQTGSQVNGQINGQISGQINGQVNGDLRGTPTGSTAIIPGTPFPSATPAENTGGYRLLPLTRVPTLSPGQLTLLEQESKFQEAVIAGGGRAFGTFFADDAVVLANGKPAVEGRTAIAAQAQWDPKQYQLTWTAEGAQMGPAGDMGFTWGHYQGRLNPADPAAKPTFTSGRYITTWRKLPDGTWKVALDASADEPAPAGSPADAACCTVPHP